MDSVLTANYTISGLLRIGMPKNEVISVPESGMHKDTQPCLHGAAVPTGIEPVIDKLGLIAGRIRADSWSSC